MKDHLKKELEEDIVKGMVKTVVVFAIKNNIDVRSIEFNDLMSSINFSNVDLSNNQVFEKALMELIK